MTNEQKQGFSTRPLHVFYISPAADHMPAYVALDKEIKMYLPVMVNEVTISDCSQLFANDVIQANPDLVFVSTAIHFPDSFFEQIDKVRNAGIKTAIWFLDDPYRLDITVTWAAHFCYVFTTDYGCVKLYQDNGSAAYHLPMAAATSIYFKSTKATIFHNDVCFISTCFPNREALIHTIAPKLATKRFLVGGCLWKPSPHYEYCDLLAPEQVNECYNQTAIVLNLNRPMDCPKFNRNERITVCPTCVNPRTFEICAAGAFQLTDIRVDLCKLYTPGVEVETYASTEELLEKIEYYLVHEQERRAIAKNGMERTLREHTYLHRIHTILAIVFPQ